MSIWWPWDRSKWGFLGFQRDKQDGKEFLVPYNQGGLIPTEDEWLKLCSRVKEFYKVFSELEIREQNAQTEMNQQAEKDTFRHPQQEERPEYIYLVKTESGPCKIGVSKDPIARLATLQNASPESLTLLWTLELHDARKAEIYLHKFAIARIRTKGEWFDLDEDNIAWIKKWDGIHD